MCIYLYIACIFFLHARTRSVFAEITNKNKCNLFTRNCDARLHFFARINFVYLSICCCALFASLTWFFFCALHARILMHIRMCVCARAVFFCFLVLYGIHFFFFGVQMEVFLAHAHPPTLLLSVLPSSWMCCGLGCLLGLLQFRWHHWPKSSTLTPFFFFCQGYLTIHTFAQEDVYFFPQSAAMFWLIDGLKTKNRIIYLYIYFRRSRTRVRLNVTVHQPQRPGRLQAEK